MKRIAVNRSNPSQQVIQSRVVQQPSLQIAMGLVGLVLGLAAIPCAWFGDTDVSKRFSAIELPGDIDKALQLSEVFAHGSGAIAILATLWWVDIRRRQSINFAAGITLVSSLVANSLKYIFFASSTAFGQCCR